ncbi:hypothetical protein MHI39_20110 [Heyndrickxia sp. FSL K6-6286]|uniref:hypothetical protein n=1 Tax=Heyndrickxia sp. FSL K6-6286 TaxID=2921510 RepID=UPI00315B18B2
MFTESSVVVKAWVRKINEGAVSVDDVPALFNLRDVVISLLDNSKGDAENV